MPGRPPSAAGLPRRGTALFASSIFQPPVNFSTASQRSSFPDKLPSADLPQPPPQHPPCGRRIPREPQQRGDLSGLRAIPNAHPRQADRPARIQCGQGGRRQVRSAGSQITRSTAKGSPCAEATRTTPPLSRSSAAAPVACHSRRLAAGVHGNRVVRQQAMRRRAAQPLPSARDRRHDHGVVAQHRRRHDEQARTQARGPVRRPGRS